MDTNHWLSIAWLYSRITTFFAWMDNNCNNIRGCGYIRSAYLWSIFQNVRSTQNLNWKVTTMIPNWLYSVSFLALLAGWPFAILDSSGRGMDFNFWVMLLINSMVIVLVWHYNSVPALPLFQGAYCNLFFNDVRLCKYYIIVFTFRLFFPLCCNSRKYTRGAI